MNKLQHEMRHRWDEKGWQYDQNTAHGIHNQEDKDEWVQLFKTLHNKCEVLDIGTGTGFLALLAAELGHNVTAIDWSKTMLQQAKDKAESAALRIHFIEGMTESLPLESHLVDAVTARHVLWTLSDPDKALAEWFRVLKPGGTVWADYSPRKEDHKGHHYNEEVENQLPFNKDVSPDTIVKHFENAGFTNIVVKKQNQTTETKHHKTTYLIICTKAG